MDSISRELALPITLNERHYTMSTQSKAKAFAALNKFANARVALIEGMQAAGYATVEECRPIVIEWACEKVGCAFNVSSTGKVMLDSSHAKYNTAKTVLRDIMLMLQGTTRRETSAKKEIDPVEQAIKAYMKLSTAQRKAFAKVAGL